MAKSKSLQRLLANITIHSFEDREKALAEAKKEAFNSRLGTYNALAYAYQWWVMSKDDVPYMEQKFKSAEIKVSDLENTNFLIPTIKLIFDLDEPRYYSRVSEYALVLQYVHRMIDDEQYHDSATDPGIPIQIIKDGEGIRKCAEKQREFNNPSNDDEPTQAEENEYLRNICTSLYKDKKPDGSVAIRPPKSETGLVLMVGRPGTNNDVEIVDVMGVGEEEIFNLTKERILNDTSNLSEALNILGDALGYLHAFGVKDEPIVTVEKGAEAITMSLSGKDNDASVVAVAKPKDPAHLKGFGARAHLSSDDQKWFIEKAQSRVSRRLYELQTNTSVKSGEVAFDLTNQVKASSAKTIQFASMTDKTVGQLVAKPLEESDILIEVGFGRTDIEDFHEWLQGWLKLKRPKPENRIIPVHFDDEHITFEGRGGSEDLVVPAATRLPAGTKRTYRLFGRDLAKVIEQLYLNPEIAGFYMRAPDGGLLEIAAEDERLEYTVDIPTVLKGDVNYSEYRFTQLQ